MGGLCPGGVGWGVSVQVGGGEDPLSRGVSVQVEGGGLSPDTPGTVEEQG